MEQIELSTKGRLPLLPANIRLGLKWVGETYALANTIPLLLTAVGFIVQVPNVVHPGKFYWLV